MAISKVVFGDSTLIDITDTTATSSDVLRGKFFYDSAGIKVEGSAVGGGMIVVETTDEYGGTIVDISGEPVTLEPKTATPAAESQTIEPDEGYTGLSKVYLEAVPTEEKTATTNGVVTPSTGKFLSKVTVNVSSTINNQNKNVVPSASTQSITADSGYTGLGTVSVAAISSDYIGSGITVDPTISISGRTVTIPSGYYSTQNTKSVSTAAQAIPSISVSNAGVITATATQTAGYVTAGTTSGTLNLTTQAAVTITPSESVQIAVASHRYTTGNVTVAAISSDYVGSDIPTRGSSDVTASGSTVSVPSGYYASAVTRNVLSGSATTPATTISITPSISVNTSTGVITATASGSQYITPAVSTGYVSAGTSGRISVSGSNTSQLTVQAAATITPTTSVQIAVASHRYTTGTVTVAAIPSQYKDITGVTATASDVVSGKTFVNSTGVSTTGSLVIQHYYTGSGAPAAATGSDGDIYLKTS